MSPKAPDRSLRSPRKPPAHRHRLRLQPSSRLEVPRISRRRSRKSPRLRKPFSVAMASRRQQSRKMADLPSAADPLVAGAGDVASENLLIFQLAGESFALRLASIAEIIRLPDVAHMPLVPPSLLGLANLRGIVLPVISLRATLQLPGTTANEQTRAIVLRGAAAVGFVVDRVDRLMVLAADQLDHDDAGAGTIDPALLDGVIKGAEGQSTIKLLNPSRLLSGQFTRLGVSATGTANRSPVAIG